MNIKLARLLCNLPPEWEDLEFSICDFEDRLYVAHPTLPPVAIEKDGTVKKVSFEEKK